MKLVDIVEGPRDQHIFKAIFMAGLPGAGKSYYASRIARLFGLKYINIDTFYDLYSKKGKPFNYSEELYQKMQQQQDISLANKLGMVFDNTGADAKRTLMIKQFLEEQGYDTAMIYVDADIDLARKRAAERERQVDYEYFDQVAGKLQQNVSKYSSAFPQFLEIKADADVSTVYKFVEKFLAKPNKAAQRYRSV